MINEMVENTPAASAVGMVMEEVMEEAAKNGMANTIWKEMERDDELMARIEKKIKDRESGKRMEKYDLERSAGSRRGN